MDAAFQWRAMTPSDLSAVKTIADQAHPSLPEDGAVFAERLRLYPLGMRLLERDGIAKGYLISHPYRSGTVPALNSALHALPGRPDTYYLHDLALLPAARGTGAAGLIVEQMAEHARAAGFSSLSLVAVNGSVPFWRRQGFNVVEEFAPRDKLESYGPDARFMGRRS